MKSYPAIPGKGDFLLLQGRGSDRQIAHLAGGRPVYRASQLLPTTVGENFTYVYDMGFTPIAEKASRLCRAGHIFGLGHLLDAHIDQLSPSERHRVELSCGLLYAPPVLLVEEPALPEGERVVHRFRWLQSDFGITTLWISPDPEPLYSLATGYISLDERGFRGAAGI